MRKIRKRHKRRRNAAEYTTWARSTRSRPIYGGISASSQCAFIIDRSLSLCKWRKYAAIPMFLHLFLWIYNNRNDSLKFKKSQRDELFAKLDFHESIRLNAEVLYLRYLNLLPQLSWIFGFWKRGVWKRLKRLKRLKRFKRFKRFQTPLFRTRKFKTIEGAD